MTTTKTNAWTLFIQEEAVNYVHHYRDLIIRRLSMETAVNLRAFLKEHFDYNEHTLEVWEDHFPRLRELQGIDADLLSGEERDKTDKKVLSDFRRDLIPFIRTELASFYTFDESEIKEDIQYISEGLREYDQTDAEDMKLYQEDQAEIERLQHKLQNSQLLNQALSSNSSGK